jgi:hypothetical protein
MWSPAQIKTLHVYQSAAKLDDAGYRQLLAVCCHGAITSKDVRLGNAEFDLLMAAMEEELRARVCAGSVPYPHGRIRNLWHYSAKEARKMAGGCTERQLLCIRGLAADLARRINQPISEAYMLAIAAQATRAKQTLFGLESMTSWQASKLIDAFKGRLQQAPTPEPAKQEEAADYPPEWDQ